MEALKDRFLQKVKKTMTCWLWIAAKGTDGYGIIKVNGKATRAHRLSYLIFKGMIKEGLFVCHSCDIRHCVNPEHLWLGTNKDNMVDASKKGRRLGPGSSYQTQEKISGY